MPYSGLRKKGTIHAAHLKYERQSLVDIVSVPYRCTTSGRTSASGCGHQQIAGNKHELESDRCQASSSVSQAGEEGAAPLKGLPTQQDKLAERQGAAHAPRRPPAARESRYPSPERPQPSSRVSQRHQSAPRASSAQPRLLLPPPSRAGRARRPPIALRRGESRSRRLAGGMHNRLIHITHEVTDRRCCACLCNAHQGHAVFGGALFLLLDLLLRGGGASDSTEDARSGRSLDGPASQR